MAAKHVVLVFGYGCHLVSELKEYLDRVRHFCNQNRPDVIIFCGGYTQKKSAPGTSEGRVMFNYVIPGLSYAIRAHLDLESYTTQDNAECAARTLQDFELLDTFTQLTVFCEATRAAEVDMVIRHFFGRRAHIETASWELAAPEKRIIPMIWTWLSLKSPRLAAYRRNQRIERSYHI